MRYVKLLVLGGVLVLGLLALLPEPAESFLASAACRVTALGTAIGSDSPGCNTDPSQTRRTFDPGEYEVDFTAVATDIRPYVKLATCDDQESTGPDNCFASTSNRAGDDSSVRVFTRNSEGVFVNRPFNVFIFTFDKAIIIP